MRGSRDEHSFRHPAAPAAGLSRRAVLAGGAVAGGLTAAPLVPCPASAAAAAKAGKPKPVPGPPVMRHAVGDPRGIDVAVTSGRNAEARFGLMFKSLPAYAPADGLLHDLAEQMVEDRGPLQDVRFSDTENDIPDIPAGYVYLGQFIDHDMTLDQTPLSQQKADPSGLRNYDTPWFDLGSVYGRGPQLDPQLYDPAAPGRLLLVENEHGVLDLPRGSDGMARLGDPRNDENLIICQLQIAFIQLHNRLVEDGNDFATARRLCRWHFQWLIVHDFLRRVVGQEMLDALLVQGRDGRVRARTSFYRPKNVLRPMMPVEYSAAAYRFGHSMIRAEYEVRDTPGSTLTVPIFSGSGPDLRGSRPLPAELVLDWNYFFDFDELHDPDDRNMARTIDTQVARPLHDLPPTVVVPTAGAITALAERNLLRGKRLGLPCGQDVARAMGVPVLGNADLELTDPRWANRAPLWFYILKEAEIGGGHRLGPVGGRIVAEVILGILAADRTSYFNAPGFRPMQDGWDMGTMLVAAGAVDPATHHKSRLREQPPEDEELEGEDAPPAP